MFKSRLPSAPPFIARLSVAEGGELPPMFPGAPGYEQWRQSVAGNNLDMPTAPQPNTYAPTPDGAPDPSTIGLPTPPPGVKKRSENPWGKGNLSQTLLDIGSAFLSADGDFFQGLGQAGQAIGGRYNELKPKAGKIEYGGPENQFEITTNEDGTKTIRKVPEFAEAIEAKRQASNAPKPRDAVDLRSRALYAISQLPPEQQPTAYADLLANPEKYGGIDTRGMPTYWDPQYGRVMSRMGMTVPQAENDDYRERTFNYRQGNDSANRAERAARANKPKAGGARKAPKPPAGFILD